MFQQAAVPLGQLFMGTIYHIPRYQRDYSWIQKPQLEDLWEDLANIFTSPKGSNHFMGTLILKPIQEEEVIRKYGRTYRLFEVIDGQ